jgi:uncharacterized protein
MPCLRSPASQRTACLLLSPESVTLTLNLLPGDYAVCTLAPGAQAGVPARSDLWSLTRTADEFSLVCRESEVPVAALKAETGWRALRFQGPFDFVLTGILASVTTPLAQAGIGIFALSTFDTDYVLVKAAQLEAALAALRAAGHQIRLFPDQFESLCDTI